MTRAFDTHRRTVATRRWPAAACAAIAVSLLFAGCSDSSGPAAGPLPPFLFTSDADGVPGLYLFDNDAATRMSAPGNEDTQPHSAAGRIVFTSRRVGNAEIYIADAALGGQLRLTNDPWTDAEPALSSAGDIVAFVSNRTGTPRIWLMTALGGDQRLLATGSAAFVPEGAPAWHPSGARIAFTSTRTGTSQVFLMNLAGGSAEQITHEATGAFLPAWSGDGRSVVYTTLEGAGTVRLVPSTGGTWRALAADAGPLSDGTCMGGWCLAVAGTPGSGDIVSVRGIGRASRLVIDDAANESEPAFLVR